MKSMKVLARGASKMVTAAAAVGMIASGCAGEETDARNGSTGGKFEISVAPLTLANVTDATFDIIVKTATETVWERTGISSTQFGNSQGDITYVGTCVAGETNSVTLTMQTLSVVGQSPLPETEWVKPGPVTISAMCVENADVPITFNLTVMRDADQGFFDVAVNFEDIFCSAKFDCAAGDFLHNGATGRDDTIILGFACTAGQGETTNIYMSKVVIECDDNGDGTYENSYPINQSAGPGNLGNSGIPGIFQVATYRGSEELPGYDKCYWNTAIGVEIDTEDAQQFNGKNCRVSAMGTAGGGTAFDNGNSPVNTVYPVIQWTVPLTDNAGAFTCNQEYKLNEGTQVTTRYTDMSGEKFDYAMDCATATVVNNGVSECTGTLAGVDGVTFSDDGSGSIVVAVAPTGGGDEVVSGAYQLPAGYSLAGCCVDPCCAE